MIIAIVRSRFRPGAEAGYFARAPELAALAKQVPGYIAHKTFVAEDGERLTFVEFESEDALQAWSRDATHVEAKREGRNTFFSEYRVVVAQPIRDRRYLAPGFAQSPPQASDKE